MKELTKPISEVRQKLPALAKAADERMARVVITQQGRPQAVLLGYEDYLGMKTAVDLLSRPGLAEGMEQASAELARGEGVALEGLNMIRGRKPGQRPKGKTQLTPEEKLLRAIFGEKAGVEEDASNAGEAAPETVQADVSEAQPQTVFVELKAKALLNKGNALNQMGKPVDAIAVYDEVIGLLSPQTQELEKA